MGGRGLGLRFGAITLMQIFPADVIAAVRGFITKRLHVIGTLAKAVLLLRRRVANNLPTNKNCELQKIVSIRNRTLNSHVRSRVSHHYTMKAHNAVPYFDYSQQRRFLSDCSLVQIYSPGDTTRWSTTSTGQITLSMKHSIVFLI